MNVQALLAHEFPAVEQSYGVRDSSLYALCAGYGNDPLDERQLRFVYGEQPKTVASMALVLANPGFWQKQAWTGIDWVRCVLGEQRLQLHRPLPSSGRVIGRLRVTRIDDKGADFGALLHSERELVDAADGARLATLSMVTICRGDGGFGGEAPSLAPPPSAPSRAPDAQCELPTLPQQALLFDLHGIVNPVHSWPQAARQAGHPRPFLHGICTLGFAHHAIARELAGYDPDRISDIRCRFKQAVYPGETLVVRMWRDSDDVVYEVQAKGREGLVLAGSASLKPSIEEICA